jgi:hypothetical protein
MYRFLARSPDLVVTGEDLLHLFRSELVPFDMENVVIIPFKAGNNHRTIVSGCIYEPLRRARGRGPRIS